MTNNRTPLMRNTKFINSFSEEVFYHTYSFNEEDINSRHLAMAKNLASLEKDKDFWTNEFSDLLEDFKFLPGGRITSNAGTNLSGTSFINCFVSGFRGTCQDSMDSIMDELKRQAKILKSEGGYGFCADVLRPRGAIIEGIGSDSPGVVKILEMWDKQSEVITAGSGLKNEKRGKKKIRKGAMMVTYSIHSPDIEEFITAKQTQGRLTKFNMSVLVTDDFMKCLQNQQPWKLEFPDYEKCKDIYNEIWDGNLKKWKEKGLPTKVYKEYKDASHLWNLIMESTYNRNEPGVIYIDLVNRMNNLYYCEYLNASNPCGEQFLPIGGVCLLGSFNLTQFVDFEKSDWDYKKLSKYIPIAVRMLDNVNDITYVPLSEQKQNLLEKRRIGMGYLGYASALMMLKIRYGSKKALDLTKKLLKFFSNEAYKASSFLAKEKGSFLLFDRDKYLDSKFIQTLDKETINLIKENGIRNSHLLSIQPTGNSSVLANNVSSGLEPIFFPSYVRTYMQPYPPDGLDIPKAIDWTNKLFQSDSYWEWSVEGDESILITKFKDEVWKYDKSRGLLKENIVMDYGVLYHKNNGTWDESSSWNASVFNLNLDDHINTLKLFAEYVDSAISKTINIPSSFQFEDFKNIYLNIYNAGYVKGVTTYREGTMTSVLSVPSTTSKSEGFVQRNSPKRPEFLECDIHTTNIKGKKWTILVGLMGDKPYEVIGGESTFIELPKHYRRASLKKNEFKTKNNTYDLIIGDNGDSLKIKDVVNLFNNPDYAAVTRLISLSLRHGAKVNYVVEQLQKDPNSDMFSFSKCIARVLKRYIEDGEKVSSDKLCPSCGSEGLVYNNGCVSCVNCAWTRCS